MPTEAVARLRAAQSGGRRRVTRDRTVKGGWRVVTIEMRRRAGRRFSRKQIGVTEEQVAAALAEQLNACLVCGGPVGPSDAADHEHATGEFRGVLHASCNAFVGKTDDDLFVRAAALLMFAAKRIRAARSRAS